MAGNKTSENPAGWAAAFVTPHYAVTRKQNKNSWVKIITLKARFWETDI